jgi:hypothetical protein
MPGSIPPLSQYIFMTWCLVKQWTGLHGVIVKHKGQVYLLLRTLAPPGKQVAGTETPSGVKESSDVRRRAVNWVTRWSFTYRWDRDSSFGLMS